mmetsp:Transcript_5498/g.8107  ORF Transcript_5498/g.8107 Transcript_5498/m.8107 type:complete len:409 (-) Transcript_5498:213-1439(-)
MSSNVSIEKIGRRDSLRYVKFGSMMVSELCAGTMNWGSFNGDESEAHAQLDTFWQAGVNWIDTAEMYPVAYNYGETTERWIGNWLTSRKIDRSKIFLATKCNPAGVGSPHGKKHAFEADIVESSCRASLKRLQTDYLDLYQIHFPSRLMFPLFGWASWGSPKRWEEARTSTGQPEVFEKQVLAIKALFDKGLIREWGLSNENAYGLTMFCITCDRLGVKRPISCQNDFSLNCRNYEGDIAEAAYEFGVLGLPYGALAGGLLTGKYAFPHKYSGDRPLALARHNAQPKFQPRYNNPNAQRAAVEYCLLAEKWGIKPVELAYAWARDRWYNTCVITGTTTVEQCKDAINAFKLEPLPEALLKAIDIIHEKYRNPCSAYADKDLVLTADFFAPVSTATKEEDDDNKTVSAC